MSRMINEKLHEIQSIMVSGLVGIENHDSWIGNFTKEKSKVVFETGFFKDSFHFTVKVTAEKFNP